MIEGQAREVVKDALSIQGGLQKLKELQKVRWMWVPAAEVFLIEEPPPCVPVPYMYRIQLPSRRNPGSAPGWAQFLMWSAALCIPPSGSSHSMRRCHFCRSWTFCFLHLVSLPVSRLFPKPGLTIWRFILSDYVKKVRHGASHFPTEHYPLALEGLHIYNFSLQFMITELLPVFSVSLADATCLCWVLGCSKLILMGWVGQVLFLATDKTDCTLKRPIYLCFYSVNMVGLYCFLTQTLLWVIVFFPLDLAGLDIKHRMVPKNTSLICVVITAPTLPAGFAVLTCNWIFLRLPTRIDPAQWNQWVSL